MEKTSTTRTQRIIIWVIAALMIFGSVGFYFLIIMQNEQQQQQQAQLQQQLEEAREPQPLPGYEAEPFEAESVNELQTETLKEGDGKTVPEGATVQAEYMGWLPSGELFDSSATGLGSQPVTLGLDSVIEGWQEGIPGMKVGEVRKLTIPAEQAYGEQGSPPTIPPNTPLAFIVKVVEIQEGDGQSQ